MATAEVDPVLADAFAGLAKLAGIDAAGLSDSELCDTAVALEHARRFLDAAQCHTLAELDTRAVTDRAWGMNTPSWLARDTALPIGVARQQLRIATRLRRDLPTVDTALTEGRINIHHARVLTDAANPRIADRFDPVAKHLCDTTDGVTFDQWRRETNALAELLDDDGGHDPTRDQPSSELRLRVVGDTTVLTGELTGTDALTTAEALNALADELFHQHRRDREHAPDLLTPDRATLLARALVEACRRALAVDLHSSRAPRPDATLVLTPDQLDHHSRFHQTLHDLGLGPTAAPAGAPGSADRDAGSGKGAAPGCAGTTTVTDAHHSPLRPNTYACLLCDADLHTVVLDSLGVPLDLGRTARYISTAQRRALNARDGGCTFPGCDSPATWTDAHHVQYWEHDGRTDAANLASLCRSHHGIAHRTGWHLELTPDGWTRWTTPAGHTFWGQRHYRQRAGP